MAKGSKLLAAIPVAQIEEIARAALAGGVPLDQVVDECVALADELVDWGTILGTPWGPLLDTVDGPLLRTLVGLIVHRVHRAG